MEDLASTLIHLVLELEGEHQHDLPTNPPGDTHSTLVTEQVFAALRNALLDRINNPGSDNLPAEITQMNSGGIDLSNILQSPENEKIDNVHWIYGAPEGMVTEFIHTLVNKLEPECPWPSLVLRYSLDVDEKHSQGHGEHANGRPALHHRKLVKDILEELFCEQHAVVVQIFAEKAGFTNVDGSAYDKDRPMGHASWASNVIEQTLLATLDAWDQALKRLGEEHNIHILLHRDITYGSPSYPALQDFLEFKRLVSRLVSGRKRVEITVATKNQQELYEETLRDLL